MLAEIAEEYAVASPRAPEYQPSMRLQCHRNAVPNLFPPRANRHVAICRKYIVPKVGLEPTRVLRPPDFESGASAIPPLRLAGYEIQHRQEPNGCQPRYVCTRHGVTLAPASYRLSMAIATTMKTDATGSATPGSCVAACTVGPMLSASKSRASRRPSADRVDDRSLHFR